VKLPQPTYTATGLLILVLVVWMASGVLMPSEDNANTEALDSSDQQTADLMKVEVTAVFPTDMERQITLQGQVHANRELAVSSKTNGAIESLNVTRGTRVSANTVIVKLSNEGRNSQLLEARARIDTASSEQNAAQKLQRQGLQSQLKAKQAQADLASARAALKRIENEIKHTEIRAPFAGIINKLPVELGQQVDKGTIISHIVDDSSFRVSASVAQQSVHQLKVGQPITVKLIDGTKVPGTLSFISAIADSATRSFEIEGHIKNDGKKIAAGVSASVLIPVASVSALFVSPSTIALSSSGDIGVKGVNQNNIVEFFPIELVETNSNGAWITGVPAGTRIITLGQGFVNEGQEVEPVAAPSPTPSSATVDSS